MLFFIDEKESFLFSKIFADTVKISDNYFVIISRKDYAMISYSIDELYELVSEIKGGKTLISFKPFSRRNSDSYLLAIESIEESLNLTPINSKISVDLVITEDSNSGYQFFSELCKSTNIICETFEGASNLQYKLDKLESSTELRTILICLDSAAFGAYLNVCAQKILKSKHRYYIFAPECFEHLILSSQLFKSIDTLQNILKNPEDYIDITKYFSWENYFTELLSKIVINTPATYSKRELNTCYHED